MFCFGRRELSLDVSKSCHLQETGNSELEPTLSVVSNLCHCQGRFVSHFQAGLTRNALILAHHHAFQVLLDVSRFRHWIGRHSQAHFPLAIVLFCVSHGINVGHCQTDWLLEASLSCHCHAWNICPFQINLFFDNSIFWLCQADSLVNTLTSRHSPFDINSAKSRPCHKRLWDRYHSQVDSFLDVTFFFHCHQLNCQMDVTWWDCMRLHCAECPSVISTVSHFHDWPVTDFSWNDSPFCHCEHNFPVDHSIPCDCSPGLPPMVSVFCHFHDWDASHCQIDWSLTAFTSCHWPACDDGQIGFPFANFAVWHCQIDLPFKVSYSFHCRG